MLGYAFIHQKSIRGNLGVPMRHKGSRLESFASQLLLERLAQVFSDAGHLGNERSGGRKGGGESTFFFSFSFLKRDKLSEKSLLAFVSYFV